MPVSAQSNVVRKCHTCCRPVDKPFRSAINGVVFEGCIAEDHDGHVADEWHLRPEAVEIRRKTRQRLAELLSL